MSQKHFLEVIIQKSTMKIVLPNQLNPVRDIIFSYYTDDFFVLEELQVPFAYRKESIKNILCDHLSSYNFEQRKAVAKAHWEWVTATCSWMLFAIPYTAFAWKA